LLWSVIPVFGFLGLLVLMDSFKLVPLRRLLQTIGVGCIVAGLVVQIHAWWLDLYAMRPVLFSNSVAPVLEELAKSAYLILLLQRRRVGFAIDAAILGFALGAGFALVENILYYLQLHQDASLFLWVVRGFGTAVMHGSSTALFATLSKSLADRHASTSAAIFLPGLLLAIAVHGLYNILQGPLHPLVLTASLLVLLPLLVVLVFERSERATRNWLGTGFDHHTELLHMITSGDVQQTRLGAYLQSLRHRFPPPVVADMLCYLQIAVELSMRAKTQLLAREAGVELPIGDEVEANLQELRYLERSIGKTGKLALLPVLGSSPQEDWQLLLLRR
jgi:RsiW-degrading membrane proteinase PrsW (M82 family)